MSLLNNLLFYFRNAADVFRSEWDLVSGFFTGCATYCFNCFLACGDFCHLLINFANSLHPDLIVGPNLDRKGLTLG